MNIYLERLKQLKQEQRRGFDTFGTRVPPHNSEILDTAADSNFSKRGEVGQCQNRQNHAEFSDCAGVGQCQNRQNPALDGFDTFGTSLPGPFSNYFGVMADGQDNPVATDALDTIWKILRGTANSHRIEIVSEPVEDHALHVTDIHTAEHQVQQLLAEDVLAVDIETLGLDPYQHDIRLVSVATRSGKATVFDLAHLPMDLLQPLTDRPWSVFNGSFEWRHLTHAGLQVPSLHDVQLLDRLASHKMHRSLADAAKEWLHVDLDKSLQSSDWGSALSPEQIRYAAADATITARLASHLLPRIQRADQRRLYDVWRSSIPVLAGLELRGMCFDFDSHAHMLRLWEEQRDTLRTVLQRHLGEGVSPTSGPQLGEWLKTALPAHAAAAWPKTNTGRLKTDAKTFALFANLPVIQPLLEFKRLQKLISTYGSNYARHRNPVTGRMHPSFRIGQTLTGRLTSSNPNVQNVPSAEDFRALFVPAPGRILIGADFSQIELRVAALLSGDKAMLDAYRNGDDLHRLTAAAVSGVAPAEVSKAQRQAAKAINFGNLFGQGPAGLARTAQLQYGADMDQRQAAEALRRFAETYPQLHLWKQQQINQANLWRQVRTRLGLIRAFDVQGQGNLKGESANVPIQGSAAEVLLCTLTCLPKHLSGVDAQLLHNVHDEILLEADPAHADAAAEGLQAAMVDGFLQVFPEGAGLTNELVEVKTGRSWAEVH